MLINLYDLLAHVKKRPSMYFGVEISFTLVDVLITGFLINAENEHLLTKSGFIFEDFNYWLTGALPETLKEELGWKTRIQHVCDSDKESLELFFDLIAKFNEGRVDKTIEKRKPYTLKWSRGDGTMKLGKFQDVEEVVVKFEIWKHEFSNTAFRFGYNNDDFLVYVCPANADDEFHSRRYTQIEPNDK